MSGSHAPLQWHQPTGGNHVPSFDASTGHFVLGDGRQLRPHPWPRRRGGHAAQPKSGLNPTGNTRRPNHPIRAAPPRVPAQIGWLGTALSPAIPASVSRGQDFTVNHAHKNLRLLRAGHHHASIQNKGGDAIHSIAPPMGLFFAHHIAIIIRF